MPTLKDNDFIKQRIRVAIGEPAKVKLMEMLNADVMVSTLNLFILFNELTGSFNRFHSLP